MGLDARVRYTKMVIKDAFTMLLKQKPLNKVTVKEICTLAEINRATFYRYYSDPFDLLDKIEQEMLLQLQEKLGSSVRRVQDVFLLIMRSIQADGEKYLALFSENGDSQFPGRIFAMCYEQIAEDMDQRFAKLSAAQREWLYYFMAQGCYGILNRWIVGGMKESVEEVSDFTDKLIAEITNVL